ncbi:hypothetical protein HZU77_014500 [Neisseriaceae bacterium TC5R-5]|nr:hypothetical protein [Neisseriaceae bacterium TC5R-5]
MKLNQIRCLNLLQVIATEFNGNKGQFADFVGRRRPQIYRLFSNTVSGRGLGEELAREFEKRLGLKTYSLDEPLPASTLQGLPPLQERVVDYEATLSDKAAFKLFVHELEQAFKTELLNREHINCLRKTLQLFSPNSVLSAHQLEELDLNTD